MGSDGGEKMVGHTPHHLVSEVAGNRSGQFSTVLRAALLGSTVLVSAAGCLAAAGQARAQDAQQLSQAVSSTTTRAGEVAGVVTDVNTGNPLAGVKVRLIETGQVVATDRNGVYRFAGVSPGSYTLDISYVGYPTEQVPVVVVAGSGVSQRVELGTTMVEMVVTARRSATASALNQQRASDLVSNVISADALGRFPDATAAEALNRLPGISFQREERSGEGQFISIRGLDSALNNVQVNGVNSAQANVDGDRRVPLDVFQGESLATVTVNKSLLPNNESEGIGGSVELDQATPLAQGRDVYRFSAEGRYQEINDSPGFKVSGTLSKIFSDDFGVLVSGSFRRRNRVAFELESQTVDGTDPFTGGDAESAAPIFIPAEFNIGDGISPQLGGPDVFPSTIIGVQYSYFDDQRDDLSLSGAIDWRPAENTLLTLVGSFNREDVDSTRSTIRLDPGEDDDEDGDLDDDVFAQVDAGAAPIDLGTIFPDFAGQGLVANPGDEIFAAAEPELFYRAEAEPEVGTNLTLGLQGETVADRWTFDYKVGFARATDGSRGRPQPQYDFEPEDLNDGDYQDQLDDLVASGALTQEQADFISLDSIFPNGPVFTETVTDGLGTVLVQGDLVEGSDDRPFFVFQNVSGTGPQIANANLDAVQAALLTPGIFLLDDVALEFERGEQNRYVAKFDAQYEAGQEWIDYLAGGFKLERAERTTTGFNNFVSIQEDDFEDLLGLAGIALDNSTLADYNDAGGATGVDLIADDDAIDLSVFEGAATIDRILRSTFSGNIQAQELIFTAIDAFFTDPSTVLVTDDDADPDVDDVVNLDTGISLVDDILNGIPLPGDFQIGDDLVGLIPEVEVDENFYAGYLMGKFRFGSQGRWEVIGGARFEYGETKTRSPQVSSVQTIDQNADGQFTGQVDNDGGAFDGTAIGVNADGSVVDIATDTVLGTFGDTDLAEGDIDFDTTTLAELSFLETDTDYFEVLPRVQVNFRAQDNLVFRGAFWTAIARPSFIDLANETTVSFEQEDDPFDAELDIEAGNPNLDNSYSYNVDLGVEYYFGNAGVISLNLYYKYIEDFVFVGAAPVIDSNQAPGFIADTLADLGPLLDLVSDADVDLPQDGTDARIFGLEFQIQKRLDFLPGFLQGFGVFGNITWQDTEADIPLPPVPDGDPLATLPDSTGFATVPFFNAPDIVATASLFYDAHGIDAALTYQYQSELLSDFNNPFRGLLFEQDFDQLDFALKYTLPISRPDVVLAFGVNDLLNGGGDSVTTTTFGRAGNVLESSQFLGRTFTFGASVKF